MKQGELFMESGYGELLPYVQGSATSREAAEAMEPHAATLRRLVLEWLREQGERGATDEEGQDATGIVGNTFRPRRRELQNAFLVVDSGRRRKTASGRSAVVWVAKEQR